MKKSNNKNNSTKSKLEIKKEKLQEVYNHIGELSDEVKKKTIQLKSEKEINTSTRMLRNRQFDHMTTVLNDHKLRPSDRSNEIRTYSRMDLDVWKYDDVRNWFNKYSTDIPQQSVIPSETGYMIRK